jgi:transcriptional regulator with XRE-family HTH domain
MANIAKKLSNENKAAADSIDIARARLVRRGPGRPVRLSLRSLRESAGKTQAQVSKASGLAQPEISKLEATSSFDDRMVSTLRRYLAALGDELELVAISKHGHRIGLAAPENAETPLGAPVESKLSLALAEVQYRMREFAAQSGHERWHEGARLIEALRAALHDDGGRPVARDLEKPKIRPLRTELGKAMAAGDMAKADALHAGIMKLSRFAGRDPVAVVLRKATETLNENLTGKVRGSIPRRGEHGFTASHLIDHLAWRIERGARVEFPLLDDKGRTIGFGTTVDAKRERDYTAGELAFMLSMESDVADPGGTVLPHKSTKDERTRVFEQVIKRTMDEHPGLDAKDKAERIFVDCAKSLGVKNPARLFDAARKREERRADKG